MKSDREREGGVCEGEGVGWATEGGGRRDV